MQSCRKPIIICGKAGREDAQHRQQSTIITVYEVEHQKTVDTKLGKQTIRFSEVIKDFYHYFQEEEAGSHKNIESKVALHS